MIINRKARGSVLTDTPLTVTANGTVNTPSGVRYEPITVNVPTGEAYTGAYQVDPATSAQTLATAGKLLSDSITVNAIQVRSVLNAAGGYTITIGVE